MNYAITEEPKDKIYESLIKYSLDNCNQFILVVREGLELGDSGHKILKKLAPFLTTRENTNKWPGTELCKSKADVYHFRCDKNIQILFEANSLFEWLQPNYPEDLSFLKAGRIPWLVSITHERDAWLEIDQTEFESLMNEVPGLKLKRY